MSAARHNGPRGESAAEQAVLGALLIDGAAWEKIANVLAADDFHRPDHRLIFGALADLGHAGAALDIVTVSEHLEQRGSLAEAGGLGYLGNLARDTPTAANIRAYADIVLERSRVRRLGAVGSAIDEAIRNGNTSAEILARLQQNLGSLTPKLIAAESVEPLTAEPVSTWSRRPSPAPRDWIIAGLVPARRVTSLLADGGLGKTTIAVQIGVHVAMNRSLFGLDVSGGPVLGIFCEDEEDELRRRVGAGCAAENIELEQVDRFVALSRDGMKNLLCTFDREQMLVTRFYAQIEATVIALQPRLLILDTLADFFGGDYLSTPHARQFIKTALGGLCVRHGCAVLLIAHPSMSGMSSGDGGGFSTAWNNAVRSRLYLRRPKTDDLEAAQDRRVLEVKKSNYAPTGVAVPLVWHAGAFIPDPEPIDEQGNPKRAAKVDTRLAIAAREYFQANAPSGSVVGFRTLFEALQGNGSLPKGSYDTVRKPLQRVLCELERAGVIVSSQVPRGYRFSEAAGTFRGHSGDNAGTPGTPGTRGHRDTPIGGVSPPSPPACPERVSSK